MLYNYLMLPQLGRPGAGVSKPVERTALGTIPHLALRYAP